MKNLVKMFKSSFIRKMAFISMVCAVLLASTSCKHDKGKDSNPTTTVTKKVKVAFRSNPLEKATITAKAEGINPVVTNKTGFIEVEEGKTVTFVASNIDSKKLPDDWLNATSVSADKLTAELKATKDVVVIFKLKDKPAEKVKITYSIVNEFDDKGIHQGTLGVIDKTAGDKTVNSGDEVQAGHLIHISATPNQFNGKHRIKEWKFTSPSMTVENTEEIVSLEVLEEHAAQGINFTVEFEKGEAKEPPLPEGKFRAKAGVYLWDNLEEVNFFDGGTIYAGINGKPEEQGAINVQVNNGDTLKYRLEPKSGKTLYEWTGVGVDHMQVDTSDNNIVTLTANNDMYLKAILKDDGMSIFSVLIKNEEDKYVDETVASVVAKRPDDQNQLIDCRVSDKYKCVEGVTGKDVVLQLMPKDPSYQIETITPKDSTTQVVQDTDDKNKFTVKAVQDKMVITIKMKKVETVDIKIDGDDHVVAENKKTFKVHKDTTWKVLKETSEIKDVQFTEGYELDKWTEDSATGTALVDGYQFANNKTIFVKSKIKMSKLTFSVKDIKGQPVDSANVSLAATKEEGGTNVTNGESLAYGTKVNFVATVKEGWRIVRWPWDVQEDPSTHQTNHTKASIVMRGYDVEVVLTAAEAVEITIKGDENVTEGKDVKLSTNKGTKWSALRWDEKFRNLKFKDGFKLGRYYIGENASGTELTDEYEFTNNATIFVTSKATNLMRFTYKVKNRDWQDMQASDYTIVVKDVATQQNLSNGADVTKGTKISLAISYTNQKLKARWWTPEGEKDSSDPDNRNKRIVTVGDNDMEVIIAADEIITITIDGDEHLKAESKNKKIEAWKGVQRWLITEGDGEYAFVKDIIKYDDGYYLDECRKGTADGEVLDSNYQINEDITMYIKTKKQG